MTRYLFSLSTLPPLGGARVGFYRTRLAALRWALLLLLYQLQLQGCGSPAPLEDRDMGDRPAAVSPAASTMYVVSRGDTLHGIARRYEVTTAALQRQNQLADIDQLEVGQRLRIPVGSSTGWRGQLIWPLQRVRVTSEYGARRGRHMGMDLSARKKTAIRASAAGVVVYSGKKKGYGRVIILEHDANIKTLYAHNHRNKVKVGQRVQRGDVIATVGHSGRATGSHVHFETIVRGRARNPRLYVSP